MVNKKTIYLDYAAATPLDPLVKKAMEPFLNSAYGNPSSLHKKGIEAKTAIEEARKKIAGLIGARAEEIVFTSGGTESCNLAVFGAARISAETKTDRHGSKLPSIVTTSIEHHAVLEPYKELEREGYGVTYLKVNGEGFVGLRDIEKAIRPDTVLVSVMYANNEIGTIEPIGDIGKLVSSLNIKRKAKGLREIIFHTDACQAAGYLDLNVNRLGVDLMSVSASKFYGPKGVGFLYIRKGTQLKPITYGGGQERVFRSGTENVAGIVGMAKAFELVQTNREKESLRLKKLRDYFIANVLKKINNIKLNGPFGAEAEYRLPNNISLSIKGIEGEALMLYLDAQGVCASTASACSTGSTERSHVIKSINVQKDYSEGTIRFTLGTQTTKSDLDYLLKILPNIILILRKAKF